jgi:hypothetical protein
MKMSPLSSWPALDVVIETAGGIRSGRLASLTVLPLPFDGGSCARILRSLAGRAIWTLKAPSSPPAIFRCVLTSTVSPVRKRLSGTKLAPLPSECASSLPRCSPLSEPRTSMSPILSGATLRKLNCVCADADTTPGAG